MPGFLRLTVTFLDPVPSFHGRTDGGEREWPPSPLRAYQALVAAAAARFRGNLEAVAGAALRLLERLPPPDMLAPPGHGGVPTRLAVPDNDLDLTAAFWARGQTPPEKLLPHRLKAMKTVRPTRLLGGGRSVQYLWPLTADNPLSAETVHQLQEIAGGLTHLGWGIDQAAGCIDTLDALPLANDAIERWQPADLNGNPLRVPCDGTLTELLGRYAAFQGRLGSSARLYDPGEPPAVFRRVTYRNAAEPAGRLWAAFELLNPDPETGGRVAVDPALKVRDVAAWVRHAVAQVCQGWPFEDVHPVARFALGHDGPGPARGDRADLRFQYLPLPSIEQRGDRGEVVGAVRRVLVAAPPGCEEQVEWVRRRLGGQPLEWDGRVVAVLNPLAADDWVRRQYTRAAAGWSSVTPVVLPGYDDRDRAAAEQLLWRSFEQAGLAPEALAGATAEWRAVGYRAGVEPTWRFAVPDNPVEFGRWPRYHVRVRFARPVAGPLAVGAGRYRGFGLFVAD